VSVTVARPADEPYAGFATSIREVIAGETGNTPVVQVEFVERSTVG
jgi:hypothetical protein